MSLDHHFAVIPKGNDDYFIPFCEAHYQKFAKIEFIAIHDDIIRYIADSLEWVQAFHPVQNCLMNNLCYYGFTLWDNCQVGHFKSVIIAWRELFKNAPDKFVLIGDWTTIVGDNDSGEYAKIKVHRDELLSKLNILINYCILVENDKDLVLVHNGI